MRHLSQLLAALCLCVGSACLFTTTVVAASQKDLYFDFRVLERITPQSSSCEDVSRLIGAPPLEIKTDSSVLWVYRYSHSSEYISVLSNDHDKPGNALAEADSLEASFRKFSLIFDKDCRLQNYQYLSTFH